MLKLFFERFEEIVGAFAIALMVSIAFLNVVTRYLATGISMAFTEEITISMFVWVTLLGISIAFRKNAHLAVTFFYDLAAPRIRLIFYLVSSALCLLFFCLLVWLGSLQVLDEMELGVTTDALAIPAWIYSGGIPVFSVLIVIRILQSTARTLRERSY